MSATKAGRLVGGAIIGVVALGVAVWMALGQPGIGLGSGSGNGPGYRDSDLDSSLPPEYTECQGEKCPSGYFNDWIEVFVGTSPLDPCANTTTANDEADDKWPPDFNDDRVVDVTDALLIFARPLVCDDDPQYAQRFDLNADTCITIDDLYIFLGYFPSACQEWLDDADGDEFPDIYENEMGTDPEDDCPDDANDPAWPPDINNDTVVDTTDFLLLSAGQGQCWPSHLKELYDVRLDMNADRCVDEIDLRILYEYFPSACTP